MPSPRKSGYTLIEVTLVIALSALLLAAFIASIAGSLAGRRYNDSVQDFADFLQNQYSRVINVQSEGTGKTTKAIYGRVITFGENGNLIYAYDVLGNAVEADTVGVSTNVFAENPIAGNVLTKSEEWGGDGNRCYAPNQEVYNISNDAWIETTTSKERLKGVLFIIRSPIDGTVSTRFFGGNVLNINSEIGTNCVLTNIRKALYEAFNESYASKGKEIDFCVASDDQAEDAPRRNIRLSAAGSNSTSVQIIPQDDIYDAKTNPGGNRCAQ